MERLSFDVGENCNCLYPEFLAGPNNPDGDFAPVCNEYLFEKRHGLLRRIDKEEWFAILDGMAVVYEYPRYHTVHITLDLVHKLHGLYDAEHLAFLNICTDFHKGRSIRGRSPVKSAYYG